MGHSFLSECKVRLRWYWDKFVCIRKNKSRTGMQLNYKIESLLYLKTIILIFLLFSLTTTNWRITRRCILLSFCQEFHIWVNIHCYNRKIISSFIDISMYLIFYDQNHTFWQLPNSKNILWISTLTLLIKVK